MLKTTAGQLLINEALPPDMRDYNRVLDKAGIKRLLTEVAEKHPEKYRDIAKKLSDAGWRVSAQTGGYSVGIQDLRQTLAARKMRQEIKQQVRNIRQSNLPSAEKEQKIIEVAAAAQKKLISDVYAESLDEDNPLALQAKSGARGSAINVNSLRGADMLYSDHHGRVIPIPVTRSYSMGLSPSQYFAGAFGARKGVVDLKAATQDAGYFAKQLVQAAHRLVVSQDDDDDPYDDTNPRGYPTQTDDADSEGALLAHPVGGYKRNTVVTPRMLKELRAAGVDEILVRSPTVGGPEDGGVYAKDAGYRERGGISPIGDFVGIAAAQALAEPVTQAQISSKHCLAWHTEVRMADFSVKQIRDIVPGDRVLGADMAGNTFPVTVLETFDNGDKQCYRTIFRQAFICDESQNIELVSTLCHKMLGIKNCSNQKDESRNNTPRLLHVGVPGRRVAAMAVTNCGTTVVSCSTLVTMIRKSQQAVGFERTYDIHVDHPDHLFVLANGLIVSNSGGIAGASAGAISGFKYINQLVQVPRVFQGGASHAQKDGTVTSVQPAPQGGHFVVVDGQSHYLPQTVTPSVKKGDPVEAGDVLSDGTPNPAEIVKFKGIGEGRRYFVDAFRKALSDSSTYGNRRNIELLSRGLINHVRLTEELGDWAPDDVMPYQYLERKWRPRDGYHVADPTAVKGQYLERPVLHYSIGTRIQPSVIKKLQKHGVKQIYAHPEPPPFEPEMVRGMANISQDPDWMTRMLGSYQKNSLLTAAHRGAVSDTAGTSYVPALAQGKDFGQYGATKSWEPKSM